MKLDAFIFRNNSLPESCLYAGRREIFSRSFSTEYLHYSINELQLIVSTGKSMEEKDPFVRNSSAEYLFFSMSNLYYYAHTQESSSYAHAYTLYYHNSFAQAGISVSCSSSKRYIIFIFINLKKGGTMLSRKFLTTIENQLTVFNAKRFGEARPAKLLEQESKIRY
jgi:hypothetical protein